MQDLGRVLDGDDVEERLSRLSEVGSCLNSARPSRPEGLSTRCLPTAVEEPAEAGVGRAQSRGP